MSVSPMTAVVPRRRDGSYLFPLARMDGINLGMTIFVPVALSPLVAISIYWLVPEVRKVRQLLETAKLAHTTVDRLELAHEAAETAFYSLWALAVGGFVFFVLGFVWLYMRPRYFELSSRGLRIVWPLRKKTMPLTGISGAEAFTWKAYNAHYGHGFRTGAGGFGGAFGIRSSRRGVVSMYMSRFGPVAVVTFEKIRPLLITPRHPEEFVARLSELLIEAGQPCQPTHPPVRERGHKVHRKEDLTGRKWGERG